MFDFIKKNVPVKLKIIFAINRTTQNYETHSLIVFHISKAITSGFGLNVLCYEVVNLSGKLYHAFSFEESSPTKARPKKILYMHFFYTSA